jgi:hypothetical protein
VPVHRDPAIGYYLVTRREDVVAAAQDFDLFSSNTDLQFCATYRPRAQKMWGDAGIELEYGLAMPSLRYVWHQRAPDQKTSAI